MRTRCLLVATLLLAFGYGPAADAALPALKGTTVVTGSAVGAMKVRLPKPTTVSLDWTPDWRNGEDATFTGDGRMLALGLVRGGGDETWFFRSHNCLARGCRTPEPRFMAARWMPNDFDVKQTTLPAGTYTLYWVTDGKPARVTLRLRGLPGRTSLRPAPVRAAVWGPPESANTVDPVSSTGTKIYSGSTEVALPHGGRVLDADWVLSERMDWRAGFCIHGDHDQQIPGRCNAGETGWGRYSGSSITCLCPVFHEEGETGIIGWGPMAPGSHVIDVDAKFAGKFGRASYMVAVVPNLP